MAGLAVVKQTPTITSQVQAFAEEKGLSGYLRAVIDLAQKAFPISNLDVALGRDAEDETHQYIAIDVFISGLETEELLTGQRIWSAGLSRVCPSHYAVYFVLGWL